MDDAEQRLAYNSCARLGSDMKITVDEQLCRGHQVCCLLCPEIFEINVSGFATAAHEAVRPEHEAVAAEAVDSCPELAIQIS
jgi:ferredoxin